MNDWSLLVIYDFPPLNIFSCCRHPSVLCDILAMPPPQTTHLCFLKPLIIHLTSEHSDFFFLSRCYLPQKMSTAQQQLPTNIIFYHKELHLRYCIGLELNLYIIHKNSKKYWGYPSWSSAVLGKYEKLTLLNALQIHFQRVFIEAFLHLISNEVHCNSLT